ncbi:hypothetical protein KAJ27_07740, partial [bacterium]|nr:hypothetical protein [bacterium]
MNYNADRQIAFLVNYFLPDGLQIFLTDNCDSNYEIYSDIIIFSNEFYRMLNGVERRWWIGHLIGHLIRKHYYYRRFKLRLETCIGDYTEFGEAEDFIFSLRYLQQIGDLSADRIAALFVNDFSVFLNAIFIEKNCERPTFEFDSEKSIIESFRENPFMLKRINEMKEFLISAKIAKVLKRLRLIYSLENEEVIEKPKPVMEQEEIVKSLKVLMKKAIEKEEVKQEIPFPEKNTEYETDIDPEAEIQTPEESEDQVNNALSKIEAMMNMNKTQEVALPKDEETTISEIEKDNEIDEFIGDDPVIEANVVDSVIMELKNEINESSEIIEEPLEESPIDVDDSIFESTPYFSDQDSIEPESENEISDEISEVEEIYADEYTNNFDETSKPSEETSNDSTYCLVYNSGNQRIDIFKDEQFVKIVPVEGLKYFSSGMLNNEKGYWIADHKNHKIKFYDETGKVRLRFGEHGSKAGQFNFPISVCQADEYLYIADSWNNRIIITDLAGNFEGIIRRAD